MVPRAYNLSLTLAPYVASGLVTVIEWKDDRSGANQLGVGCTTLVAFLLAWLVASLFFVYISIWVGFCFDPQCKSTSHCIVSFPARPMLTFWRTFAGDPRGLQCWILMSSSCPPRYRVLPAFSTPILDLSACVCVIWSFACTPGRRTSPCLHSWEA